MKNVSLKRDDLTLAGTLYMPAGFDEKARYKAVVVAGSFTSVKEQMAGTYARKFAEKGFVALVVDYAHYGESEGQPRQLESPDEKLSDLKAAVGYLIGLPWVQAVAMVGVCTSATNAAFLAVEEPRINSLATVAAFLLSPDLNNAMFGEAEIVRRRSLGAQAKLKHEQTGEVVIVPAYSTTDPTSINYNPKGSYDYYLNPSRGGVPQWKNEFAVMSYGAWLDINALAQAPAIKIPTIVVHSDGSAFPDQAKKFYDLLGGVKELAWGDGSHFDYYDRQAQVDFAVTRISDFLNKHLA